MDGHRSHCDTPGAGLVDMALPALPQKLQPISRPRWSRFTTNRHTSCVTSAAGTPSTAITARVHSLNRPNMVSVGTIVWLSSELMFFAGLFAMYFVARANNATGQWPMEPTELNLWLAVPVTTVLILSSVTCQMGVFAA